jgi:acetoacetyl-CoA synthetase
VVEDEPEVVDSLVVHLEDPAGGQGELMLFVVLHEGDEWSDDLVARIRAALRTNLSPRHVPDLIAQVPMVPRNRTGKKLELPVKRILQGHDADSVASRDVLAEPGSLDPYVQIATERAEAARSTP